MPILRRWIVTCDDGCGESFQVEQSAPEHDIYKWLPTKWMMLQWGRGTDVHRRYFAGPEHAKRFLINFTPKETQP